MSDPIPETYPTPWGRLPSGVYHQRRDARPTPAQLDGAREVARARQAALRDGKVLGMVEPFACGCCGSSFQRAAELADIVETGACSACQAFLRGDTGSYLVYRSPTFDEVLLEVERWTSAGRDCMEQLQPNEVGVLIQYARNDRKERENRSVTVTLGERYRSIVEKAEPVLRALDGKLVRVGIDPPPKYSGGTWEGALVLSQEWLHDVRELLDRIGAVNAYAGKHSERILAYLDARKAEAVNGAIPKRTFSEKMLDEREAALAERDVALGLLREARDQGIAWGHDGDLLERIKAALGEP